MTAKIIGVIQVKGGAGRSTLATNLAGEFSKLGKTVLIDGDMPLGTSASWYAIREQAGKAGSLLADTVANLQELVAKVNKHKPTADYIVLDGPPRIAEMTRAIMVLADLCLVPVGASVAEIWATSDMLNIIEQAKKVRHIDARMIWTWHRSFTNLAKELTEQASKELGLPILRTPMALRVAYQEALGTGLAVAETPDQNARMEMSFLLAEISKILR